MIRIALILALGATMVGTALALTAESKEEPSPYEIVLIDDKVQFEDPTEVSMGLLVRNLGVKKMIAPDLYWGLSIVWDGKEYKRSPKYIGDWNGPWEIIPKTAWRTGVSLSEYLVPPAALTPGKHVLYLEDEFSKSNSVTIFIQATLEKASLDDDAEVAAEARRAASRVRNAIGPDTRLAPPKSPRGSVKPTAGMPVNVVPAKAEPTTGEAAVTDEKADKKPTQYVAKIKLVLNTQDGKSVTALDTKIAGTVGTPLKLALGGTGKTRIELEIDEVADSKPKQYVAQFTVVDTKPGGAEVFLPSPRLFIQEGISSGLKVERENGNRMEIEMTVTEVPAPEHAVQTAKTESRGESHVVVPGLVEWGEPADGLRCGLLALKPEADRPRRPHSLVRQILVSPIIRPKSRTGRRRPHQLYRGE